MTGGVLGNGTRVGYAASSPITWKRVGQLEDVTIPGLTPDKIDTTVHGNKKFKRNMPGMIAVDDMTLKILQDLDPATSESEEDLRGFSASQETIYWRVEVPVDREQSAFRAFIFRGWVQKFTPTAPIMGKQELTCGVVFDDDDFIVEDPGDSLLPDN